VDDAAAGTTGRTSPEEGEDVSDEERPGTQEAVDPAPRDAAPTPAPRAPRRTRRLGLIALGLVAVVAVGALGFAAVRQATTPSCPAPADHPEWSVARRWDEALLDAIRRSLPNPPVHARNLFHTSVALWDAWAAYDPTAVGYVVTEKLDAPDREAARAEAMSYAAYRVLASRFIKAVGGDVSMSQFADVMDALCYPLDVTTTQGDSPAALGNRIAEAVIAYGLADGSNQANGYAAEAYKPVNPPLVVDEPGITMTDPNRWQPLQIAHMISQNGIPIENGVQQAVGPHWGHVAGFGIPDGGASGVPFDPGPPPQLGGDPASDAAYKESALEVIRRSSQLDGTSEERIDISPAAWGNNPLGTNDGTGREVNPVTGRPYEPDMVRIGDFARTLTEYWADGPKSETPPGHWNVIANEVSDELDQAALRVGAAGSPVNRLEWDTKLYLALNGAVHDAAIAAWGLKGHYDSVRPISMIRWLASRGQSSDPSLPSYAPDGIPLEAGLVELVTTETTAPGGRHEHLAGHEGEIAIRAWAGNPDDPETQVSGVGWILGTTWVPYQLPTFVTPAFQGYTSGHSTFSRAAAEVLTAFTGSEFFPGGLGTWTKATGELTVEEGPAEDVVLQAATYYDAADMAGLSRLYGGIHIAADDLNGRVVGSECGKAAWSIAQRYYEGTAGS
jgi:hypothetical protein